MSLFYYDLVRISRVIVNESNRGSVVVVLLCSTNDPKKSLCPQQFLYRRYVFYRVVITPFLYAHNLESFALPKKVMR